MDSLGFDDLPYALLVTAWQEDEIVGIERETRRGPRDWMSHLFALLHRFIHLDNVLLRAQQFPRYTLQHLLVALRWLAGFGGKANIVSGGLERCVC